MYKLSKQERTMLIVIMKNARIDYYRRNKCFFEMLDIDEEILCSKENVNEIVENKLDNEIQVNTLENIFSNINVFKIVKALTYNEKLVLSLYYLEGKSDEEIGKILFMTRSAANKKRLRAIDKIKSQAEKRGISNVQ